MGRMDQGKKQVFQGVGRLEACADLQTVEVMMCSPTAKPGCGTCRIDGFEAWVATEMVGFRSKCS